MKDFHAITQEQQDLRGSPLRTTYIELQHISHKIIKETFTIHIH
jgi:hypothetical protein